MHFILNLLSTSGVIDALNLFFPSTIFRRLGSTGHSALSIVYWNECQLKKKINGLVQNRKWNEVLSSRLTMNEWVTPDLDTGTQSGARSHIPAVGIPWWRHQMETFSALLAICAGKSPVNSPHKGQCRGALMFSLICVWINGWVNNREAGDLRRHRAHYDVTVMPTRYCWTTGTPVFCEYFGVYDSPTQMFHRILVTLRWVNIKVAGKCRLLITPTSEVLSYMVLRMGIGYKWNVFLSIKKVSSIDISICLHKSTSYINN